MSDQPYSIQKFRGGFAIVWRDDAGKRHRHTLVAQDRRSAEAEARERWEAGDDSPWTVGRIVNSYIATLAGRPSHQRRKDAWKAMRSFWENVDPARIDATMAADYRASRPVSDATARLELATISNALNWAIGEKVITSRPSIPLPPKSERKLRHLSRAEFARFNAEVKAEHAKVYVALGLYTMARPSAILDLTWDRVDFMRRQIDFNPPGRVRTSKKRPVTPIGNALLAVLQKAYAARTCDFVVEHGGEQVGSIKKAFQAASARSNVHATPYTLRHTGAVWAAEAGVPMPELAQMMGHDDDRTTQAHYARFGPDYLRGVADAIENGKIMMGGSK